MFNNVLREMNILQTVSSIKGCIKLYDIFYDSKSVSLVFPFFPKGDLDSYIKRISPVHRVLPEDTAKRVFS